MGVSILDMSVSLDGYDGDAAALEPLRAAIAAAGAKVEQETIQQRLYALLD